MTLKIITQSVLGGWQTAIEDGEHIYPVGPVHNASTEVWEWQRRTKLRVGDEPKTGKFYSVIAGLLQAKINCEATNNIEWRNRHGWRIEELVKEHCPSGSGFDNGTTLDESSTPEKLVFTTAFHHMNETGYYDGWSNHKVIVSASLVHGFNINITGANRNDIKDFIGDTFSILGSVEIAQPYNKQETPA